MNDVTLKVEWLNKAYNMCKPNEVQVLHDVSLQVTQGRVFALFPPSGARKPPL